MICFRQTLMHATAMRTQTVCGAGAMWGHMQCKIQASTKIMNKINIHILR